MFPPPFTPLSIARTKTWFTHPPYTPSSLSVFRVCLSAPTGKAKVRKSWRVKRCWSCWCAGTGHRVKERMRYRGNGKLKREAAIEERKQESIRSAYLNKKIGYGDRGERSWEGE